MSGGDGSGNLTKSDAATLIHGGIITFETKGYSFMCFNQSLLPGKGIFFGGNPFDHVTPVFMLQLSLAIFIISTLIWILRPLRQTTFVAQLLGGILIGPSGLLRSETFKENLFTRESMYPVETIGYFGCMLFLFLVGVKMDVSIVKRCGKKAWAIGLAIFFIPLICTIPFAFILSSTVKMEKTLQLSLPFVAVLESSNSFHSISCLLSDLKLLNSEIGHLAISASMISGLLSWTTVGIAFTVKQSMGDGPTVWLSIIFSSFGMVAIIVYALRPIVIWMIRKSPEGKPLQEGYLIAVVMMIMGTAFVGELIGQHALFGPMVLGLAIPDGPPIGSALTEKLEWFVSGILLPLYFLIVGGKTDVFIVQGKTVLLVQFLAFLGLFGKLAGSIGTAFMCHMPFQDAITLGLILSSLGILDVQFFSRALGVEYINNQCFAILIVWALILTAVIGPVIKIRYNPSRKYVTYKKHTIQHTKRNSELRVLVCIYNQENVPTIINLLEASNPTITNPIVLYALHLVELFGRASPLFIAHSPQKKPFAQSELIVNTFRIYEEQNQGALTIQPFTSVSPFDTVHDDVCTLALNKRTCLVVIPFHRQWNPDGIIESTNSRNANKQIIDKAPCSVGILIDRGTTEGPRSVITTFAYYRVAVIFLGGADDREALAYSTRMSEHPNVYLTVIRVMSTGERTDNLVEMKQDNELISDFRLTNVGIDRISYREETVMDGVGTVNVIRTLEDSYELILVGRRHAADSPLLMGLSEWNEFPELGYIGDMLASNDFHCNISVLVVQQHACAADTLPESTKENVRLLHQSSHNASDMP